MEITLREGYWIKLHEGWIDNLEALVNTVMNLQVP
jgi:hypothetical protein